MKIASRRPSSALPRAFGAQPCAIVGAVAVAALLSGCGHVPLASIPKLMRIDFDTTNLQELRAAVLVPVQIKPAPRSVTMSITVLPGAGGRHERSYPLEEIADPAEIAQLPAQASPGMRLIAYRLAPRDAAQLDVFRAEMRELKKEGGPKNKGSIGLSASKVCQSAPLPGGPLYMTTYLKTTETGGYIVAARDVDLREAATAHKIDLATAIPPCPAA